MTCCAATKGTGRESPPFAERKGARGMLSRHSGAHARHSERKPSSFPRRRESIVLNHDCHDFEMMNHDVAPHLFPLWIPAFAGMTCCAATTWEGWGASCQSFPRHSLRACHSERSEESSPFAERKGARGMLTVQQLPAHPLRLASLAASPYAEAKGTGRSIMAIIPSSWQSWFTPSPLDSRLRGNDGRVPRE